MKLPAAPAAGFPLRSNKLRGIKAELRRSQPGFALKSFAAVAPPEYPVAPVAGSTLRSDKLQGILAKANK